MKLALALFVVVSRFASAEVSWRQNLELIPQYRALNQSGFIEGSVRYELYGLIASHLEWSRESWFFEIKPEIRSVTSSGVHEAPPFNVTAQTSRRWLNSRRLLKRERDFDAYIDLNRANLRWT